MILAHLVQAVSGLPTDASALESSISALEREVKALESSSIPWEHSVWAFNFLVVVGVIMELWVIRHEYRENKADWSRGTIRSPERPSTPKYVMEVLSVVLIVLGIIGELGVGIKITSINGILRSKNAELRADSDQLVALINSEAEEAKRQAKAADLARAKLEKEIAPRTLDEAARIAISKQLAQFSSSLSGRKVKVMSYSGDAEGITFSLEIIDVLTRAKIDVDPVVGRLIPVGLVDMGVEIGGPVSDEGFIRTLAADIRSNADTSVSAGWNTKYTDLSVLVAAKPIAGLPDIRKQATKPNSH